MYNLLSLLVVVLAATPLGAGFPHNPEPPSLDLTNGVLDSLSPTVIPPELQKRDLKMLYLCKGATIDSCSDFNISDKCISLKGHPINKKTSSFVIRKGFQCTFYITPDCNAAFPQNTLKADTALMRLAVFGWNDKIQSFNCWDAKKKKQWKE